MSVRAHGGDGFAERSGGVDKARSARHRPRSPTLAIHTRLPVSKSLFSALSLAASILSATAGDAYKWSVHYLIDNSQAVGGRSQRDLPRRNRGLALSPDGRYLYAGYHHSWDSRGEVRKLAIDISDFERATSAVLQGPLGKAIATDDKGRVYICDNNEVVVYDADLAHRLFVLNAGACDGVTTTREGGTLIVLTSDRTESCIRRWLISEKDLEITGAKLGGFDGSGTFNVPNAQDLRGMKVDGRGNIWVCDLAGNRVFRIRRDGKDFKSVDVKSPIDLAFDKNRVFVTRWTDRAITVLDDEMIVIGNLNIPWSELAISAFGNSRMGALSGIVTVPGKGFFVTNEGGQTANHMSIYGKADDNARSSSRRSWG